MMWLGSNYSQAQQYYAIGDTISGNGFTYVCDLDPGTPELGMSSSGFIRVRNLNNILTDQVKTYRNGDTIYYNPLVKHPNPYTNDYVYMIQCNIFNFVLDLRDKNNAEQDRLMMDFYIDSDTGHLLEIEFLMNPYNEGFTKITPEKLFRIETMLKEQLIFQMTSVGQNYNFNKAFSFFRGRDIGMTYDFNRGEFIVPTDGPIVKP